MQYHADQIGKTENSGDIDYAGLGLIFDNNFVGNTASYCNHIDKGSIYFLERGAKVKDERGNYSNNSAMRGGFAYIKDPETYFVFTKPATKLLNTRAYFGGIFYLEKGAIARLVGGSL